MKLTHYCKVCDGNSFDLDTGERCQACAGEGRVPADSPHAGDAFNPDPYVLEDDDGRVRRVGPPNYGPSRITEAHLEIAAIKKRND